MTYREIVIVIVATAGIAGFFAIAAKNIETFCAVSFWRNGKAKLEKLVLLGNQQSQPEPDICVIASLGSRLVGFDSGAWLIRKN